MPKLFDDLGVRFQYPDNWRVDDDASSEGVSVYSPGGSFWSLTIHPPGKEPIELLDQVLGQMKTEYRELDSHLVQLPVAGDDRQGLEMNFVCLDLTCTAVACAFEDYKATYLVLYEADDRELEQIEPVFRAISASLSVTA